MLNFLCHFCVSYACCIALDVRVQVRLIEGAYVQLEDAYCLRSVEEAMRIAEPIEVCGLDVYHQFFFLFSPDSRSGLYSPATRQC